jgi:copper chaperone NosL
MKRLAAVLLLLLGCRAPESGPVEIAYGEDACDLCRMIISEAPFAAEARFGPDRVEKYDDVGCLGERLWGAARPASMWVADHASGKLHALESMHFVRAPELKTPMGSGVAAFRESSAAEAFAAKHRGRRVSLDDIKNLRKPG